MGILHSFFDESGKFQDHQIVAFCGFGAFPSQLRDFDAQWENQLRRTGLEALHWVKARRYRKRLSRRIGPQSLKERMDELKPFADCINDYLGIGVATAFEAKGYTSFAPESKKLLGGTDNPFYVQFLRTILLLLEFAKAEESITITCDEDEQTSWNCYQLYRRVKDIHPLARRRLGSVTFADDVHFPALQAADMLSFLCREHAHAQFYKTPYEYYEFFKYLTEPRGSSSLEWRVAIKNKRALKKLDNRLSSNARSKGDKNNNGETWRV
ncbi:MAG: DUF3800 domain-containing protein [Terriglobales bacterium]